MKDDIYMWLLEYDNMVEARKEAKEAKWYAIAAIVLTIISLIISIIVR